MRALPESREALSRLAVAAGVGVMAELDRAAARLEELVPGVVAFSVDVVRSGVTLTYVGALPEDPDDPDDPDGPDGPDDRDDPDEVTASTGRRRPWSRDRDRRAAGPLDEGAWQRAASSHAAPGVRSSLSLPVVEAGAVIADVTVYGSAETTFAGRSEEIADLFGAWPGGAVSNADLSFDTRREAVHAPVRLTELGTIELAAQLLARERGLGVGHVRDRLYSAAARAGIPVVRLARLVIDDRDPS